MTPKGMEMKMTRWTEENTEGFTASELAEMNAAQAALEAEWIDVDPSNIADKLNNAFCPGMTAENLIAAVKGQ